MKPQTEKTDWSKLLADAVNQPGIISKAYSMFYTYSVGNQILAMTQCYLRGIDIGPINTFKGWQNLGRIVKKGEKAISLCMPITMTRKAKNPNDPDDKFTMFVEKPRWFVISQTEGDDYITPEAPGFDFVKALSELGIEQVKFADMDGNVQGYAKNNEIAINPLAVLPHKTGFHELAHIVLGHTKDTAYSDDEKLPRNIKEVEAECTALICLEALDLTGAEFSRGYIQGWLQTDKIDEKTSQRIFKAADKILKAGRDVVQDSANVAT